MIDPVLLKRLRAATAKVEAGDYTLLTGTTKAERDRALFGDVTHVDESIWCDESGDVTHAIDRDAMTLNEIARLEQTGWLDPKHLVAIPYDNRTDYDSDLVARVLEAADNILPETFTADELIARVRALADKRD